MAKKSCPVVSSLTHAGLLQKEDEAARRVLSFLALWGAISFEGDFASRPPLLERVQAWLATHVESAADNNLKVSSSCHMVEGACSWCADALFSQAWLARPAQHRDVHAATSAQWYVADEPQVS